MLGRKVIDPIAIKVSFVVVIPLTNSEKIPWGSVKNYVEQTKFYYLSTFINMYSIVLSR